MAKQLVSIRMSETGKELLERLQEYLGASQASVFEMGLRELARKEGITLSEKKDELSPSKP